MHHGILAVALHIAEMVEAFSAFGIHRVIKGRQQALEFHRDQKRVLHLALGVTRMDRKTVDSDFRAVGEEAVIAELIRVEAVDRIGEVRAEAFDREVLNASADFLIRCEGNSDRAVFEFGMLLAVLQQCHDRGDPGFIVAA